MLCSRSLQVHPIQGGASCNVPHQSDFDQWFILKKSIKCILSRRPFITRFLPPTCASLSRYSLAACGKPSVIFRPLGSFSLPALASVLAFSIKSSVCLRVTPSDSLPITRRILWPSTIMLTEYRPSPFCRRSNVMPCSVRESPERNRRRLDRVSLLSFSGTI